MKSRVEVLVGRRPVKMPLPYERQLVTTREKLGSGQGQV